MAPLRTDHFSQHPSHVSRLIRRALAVTGAALTVFCNAPLRGQTILHWADLTAAQLTALDRTHTVVIVPAGTIVEHGSLLPSGAELFLNVRFANDLAADITARPGWSVVLLPTVPLGSGAFDRRAGRSGFSGSLAVRASTVQAVFTDLADNIGQQGFRFVIIFYYAGYKQC